MTESRLSRLLPLVLVDSFWSLDQPNKTNQPTSQPASQPPSTCRIDDPSTNFDVFTLLDNAQLTTWISGHQTSVCPFRSDHHHRASDGGGGGGGGVVG